MGVRESTGSQTARRGHAQAAYSDSESPTARLYRVQRGDDLLSIAMRFYGVPDFWVLIRDVNQLEYERGALRAGQILHIPEF